MHPNILLIAKPSYFPNFPGAKGGESKRTRQTYSRSQTLELEKEFHYHKYLTRKRRQEISETLHLTERQVSGHPDIRVYRQTKLSFFPKSGPSWVISTLQRDRPFDHRDEKTPLLKFRNKKISGWSKTCSLTYLTTRNIFLLQNFEKWLFSASAVSLKCPAHSKMVKFRNRGIFGKIGTKIPN